ncbi:MAG: outer membrane lipoprotein carrier protein LolA [Deltaproteobacteria bacterium]|nr:outer membrane lipoprotein carrier protein LolA [Deltaproteobacteria bacterium]
MRKALFPICLFFALVLFGIAAYGAPKDKVPLREDLLDGLTFRYGGLYSLRAGYTRTTTTPSTDAVFNNQASQVASGVLFWKKPYSLRLEQASPRPEEMLTNGNTAWWYIPEEKIVHVYKDVDISGEFYPLTTFFDGLDELKKYFKISSLAESAGREGEFGFVLTPLKEGTYGTITVFCDKDSILKGFRMNSVTGEQTDFVLRDLIVNPDIADSRFVYAPIRGVKVLEETMEGGFE